ncbi:MAG: 6-phosphofructokinase [Candidatus Omnitrophica bacterium]|nr:6-phosphofructokinase [Candidatus Omnitrophota bacterium]
MPPPIRRIGLLTGGGDCPGLNPVIRAVVRKSLSLDLKVVGIRNGWKGLIEKDTFPMDIHSVTGILHRGGTILGTSRTNPYKDPKQLKALQSNVQALGLEALIAIGGEDTLGVALRLHEEGLKVIGVPKTIDNDLANTDYTFGFDTAVNIAMESIDRLHTTAESHNRIMVVEVMGRHAGWIAVYAGIAGGADCILIPELPIQVDEVCAAIQRRHARGRNFSIVVVAEGAEFAAGQTTIQDKRLDEFGHVRLGGIGDTLGKLIEEKTGFETRVTVLGHVQRGGTPTAFDRVLGTRFGVKAVELVLKGEFGKMVSLQGNAIVSVPIESAVKKLKTVDTELYEIAKIFFG